MAAAGASPAGWRGRDPRAGCEPDGPTVMGVGAPARRSASSAESSPLGVGWCRGTGCGGRVHALVTPGALPDVECPALGERRNRLRSDGPCAVTRHPIYVAVQGVHYRRLKPEACPPESADVRPVDGGPQGPDVPTPARTGAIRSYVPTAVVRQAGAFGRRLLPAVLRAFYRVADCPPEPATLGVQGSDPCYRRGGSGASAVA